MKAFYSKVTSLIASSVISFILLTTMNMQYIGSVKMSRAFLIKRGISFTKQVQHKSLRCLVATKIYFNGKKEKYCILMTILKLCQTRRSIMQNHIINLSKTTKIIICFFSFFLFSIVLFGIVIADHIKHEKLKSINGRAGMHYSYFSKNKNDLFLKLNIPEKGEY